MGKLLETERTQFDNTWHSAYGKKFFVLLPNTGSFLLLVIIKAYSKSKMSKHHCFPNLNYLNTQIQETSWVTEVIYMRNMPFSATILGIRDEERILAIKCDYILEQNIIVYNEFY